jgi:hypothetical protein
MAGHQWQHRRCYARRRSDGLPCFGIGLAPNFRCKWHGGNEYTDAHREAVSKGLKAFWEGYRRDKAAGLPVPRVGRPKRVASAKSP